MRIRFILPAATVAAILLTLAFVLLTGPGASSAGAIVSSDPSAVPTAAGEVSAAPWSGPASSDWITSDQAVQAAEKVSGTNGLQVIREVGVISMQLAGSVAHPSAEPVWAVVERYNTPIPFGPGQYRDNVDVINAETGQWEYAYLADPVSQFPDASQPWLGTPQPLPYGQARFPSGVKGHIVHPSSAGRQRTAAGPHS